MVYTGNIILTASNGSTYTISNIDDVTYEGELPYVIENPIPEDNQEQFVLNLGGVVRGYIIKFKIVEQTEELFKNKIKTTRNLQGKGETYYDFSFPDWGIDTITDEVENGAVVKKVVINQVEGEVNKAVVTMSIIYGNIQYKG